MTSSTPNIGFEEEKPTENIGLGQESSAEDIGFTEEPITDIGFGDVTNTDRSKINQQEEQPSVEFTNNFDNKKIFSSNKSWLDWDTEYDFSDYTNTFLQGGDEEFDLYAEPNDKTRNIFNKSIDFSIGEDTTPNLESRLKFLSVYDFIKGNQLTNLGFNNKPIKGLRDRQRYFK